MQKIKFRAWDKKVKQMLEIEKIHFSMNKIICFDLYQKKKVFSQKSFRKSSKDIILMQYTGIKDKNGKEIYEGDIVKTQYIGSEGTKEIKYNIKYNFSGFGFIENLDTSEIIGNIYENPELLKDR